MSQGAFAGLRPRGGGLRFELFGFPTRIQGSFFLVVIVLGLFPGATFATVAIWTSVAAVSILWHELGHAFAARRLGAEPTIDLYSFGGLTHWRPRTDATRWQMISVALAGPMAGLLLGGVVALFAWQAGTIETENLRFFVVVVLWINVGWGLVNLLPVLPLDGGHILAELLPGDRDQRWHRAAWVSVITGVIAAVVLIAIGYYWGALVFGWAIATNITTLRAPAVAEKARELDQDVRDAMERLGRREEGAVDDIARVAQQLGPRGPLLKLRAIETAAASGDARATRRILDELPGAAPPAVFALVDAVETGGLEGLDSLREIMHREPTQAHTRWFAIGLHRAGRLHEIIAEVHNVPAPRRDPGVVEAAAAVAEWAGDETTARELRSLPAA